MRKYLKILSVAMLVAVCAIALAFAGCSDKAGSVKKAFEKEGYTVTEVKAEDSDILKSLLSEEEQEEISKYSVIQCSKKDGLSSASVTVVVFPSADKIKEVLGDDQYDKAVESGFINVNCYLVLPLSLSPDKIVEIFKNA